MLVSSSWDATNLMSNLRIHKAVCYVLYAYDIGWAINLERCRTLVSSLAPEASLHHNRHAPQYFDINPPPLLVTLQGERLALGTHVTQPEVDILLNDYGGVSISYAIEFTGDLSGLLGLSCELRENKILLDDSLRRVQQLLKLIGKSVEKPLLAGIFEDYAVFQIEAFESDCPADRIHEVFAQDFARILRAESQELSRQEAEDALACRISFSPADMTLIDWNAALILDRSAEDVRLVLEFANLELLEMRLLDRQLDASLDRSYSVLSKGSWQPFRGFRPSRDLRMVSQMQMEGAVLFERVSNALKLLGDQYLARVYRLASQRFHLNEWNSAILRKIEAIDSLYEKMHNRNASLRLEILEWIVIILIAMEIIIPFFPWIPH